MEQVQHTIKEQRDHTDASLGAERATSDCGEQRSEIIAQQQLDDLIERDRIAADQSLLTLRNNADSHLARDRSAAPSPTGGNVAQMQLVADQEKKAERDEVDALVQGERQRCDSFVDAERKKLELHRTQLDERRQETDDQLSFERKDSDVAVFALGATKGALAISEAQQEHYNDILGIVTHDLRSPIAVIAMSADEIAKDTQEPATRKLAQLVTQAAARMERLTADLLDAVRIQSGNLHIAPRSQSLDALLVEVRKSYGPLFASRGLVFSVDVPTTAIVASFDHDRVVQVLSNLLGNAMKFTPRGGTVTLHVRQSADQVEFSLSDNGPGICPNDLPHIFERFWQIDKHSRRGLGLGLYICKTIVEAHHGMIEAASEFGKGTTIRFALPVNQ